MTECSSVGRAIDCSVEYCVSVFSEINWSLVRFRPLGFWLEAFTWVSRPSLSASAGPVFYCVGKKLCCCQWRRVPAVKSVYSFRGVAQDHRQTWHLSWRVPCTSFSHAYFRPIEG